MAKVNNCSNEIVSTGLKDCIDMKDSFLKNRYQQQFEQHRLRNEHLHSLQFKMMCTMNKINSKSYRRL